MLLQNFSVVFRALSLLCLLCNCLSAQEVTEFTLPESALENGFSPSEDAFGESQYAELLNLADSLTLAGIGLLPDSIHQLLEYRRQNGLFVSPYELQQLPGWDAALIRHCLQTLQKQYAGRSSSLSGRKGSQSLSGMSRQGVRLSANMPLRPAFTPRLMQTRLRFYCQNRQVLRWGFSLEKDRGEPWQYGQKPPLPDYLSGHLLWRPARGILHTLALGDYELRLGQGLLIYQGFGLFKGGPPESLLASGLPLRAHTGMDEMRFLRGVAAELSPQKSRVKALLFISRKKTDARFDSLGKTVYSLPQTGYHPADSKSWRKQLGETVAGGSLQWSPDGRNKINANLLYLRYDTPLQLKRNTTPYQQNRFSGQQSIRISIDHRLYLKQLLFFGEWVLAEGQYPALLQGLLVPLGEQLDISLLHRYYHPRYTDFYAAPFSEASSPRNEQGLYMGLRYRINRQWLIDAYSDLWVKPAFSYHYNSPRRGYDGQLRIQWERRKHGRAYLQFRFKNKEQFKHEQAMLYYERLSSWRFHFLYQLTSSLEWRMRLERKHWAAPSGKSHGLLLYQELVFAKLGFPLLWNVRWTHYRTDSYDARIYAYERGLLDQHGIAVFSGTGQHLRLNSRYKINKSWTAELGLSLYLRQENPSRRFHLSTQLIGNF